MMKLVCPEPRAWGWRWRGAAPLRDNKGPSAREQEGTERQSRRLRVSCPGTWTLACGRWEPLNIEELQVSSSPPLSGLHAASPPAAQTEATRRLQASATANQSTNQMKVGRWSSGQGHL